MTRAEAKELIPLHALGVLDEQTARAINNYLRTASLDERREADELGEIAALLPLALASTPLPPNLKDRLLERIGETAATAPTPTAAAQILPFTPKAQAKSAPPSSLPSFGWLRLAAGLAFVAAALFLLRENYQLVSRRDELSQNLEQLQRDLDRFISPNTKVIALVGDEAPQANAKLIWDTARHEWTIHVRDLPAPAADRDYQLWYVTKDAKISAKVFRPDHTGRTELHLSVPPEIAGQLAATAVTLEPKGGSAQPTGKFYLKAAI